MGTTAARLRAVDPDELPAALAAALHGGPPVAPLPADPGERTRALAALRLDEPVPEPDTAVVVLTSGSTGQPKGVVLSRAAVRASAAATSERLGGPGDWVLALPTHYVAGLMVLARAFLDSGTVTSLGPDLAGLDEVARTGRRRYLSVVPTQLVRGLADPATTRALAGLDAVLVGGGPSPAGLLDRARAAGVPVRTTYGMSETCGGCVYDGVPLAGVEVVLDDDGRVSLGGPTVFSGYRLRPDLTAAALREGRALTADRARWVEGTDGVRRLEVLGRIDDVVISGGLNVDLAEVERHAAGWPALAADPARPPAELVVLGVPHPEWGTEVVAVSDRALPVTGLRKHLSGSLPGDAAPRRLVVLDGLPRTSSGKIDRQRIRALLSPDPPGAKEGTA